MSYLQQEKDLQEHVGKDMMEAFEKFYHDDIVMVEADGSEFKGKDANRKREEEWLGSISEYHGGGVKSITSNEDEGITMTEMWIDASFKDGSRLKMEQVSVKKWEGDKVRHERFYYNM